MNKRTSGEDRQMLLLAHASRYHWGLVGTARNHVVGDWQLSRIYAALGQPALALSFAKAALSICQENGLSDITPSAHEGVARAYAAAKETPKAEENLAKARRLLDKLDLGDEDRKIYLDQFEDTQRLIDGSAV